MKIEAKIEGVVLDRSSVITTEGGFYRSFDNTIVWDRGSDPDFDSVSSGEKGVVGFSFAPISNISVAIFITLLIRLVRYILYLRLSKINQENNEIPQSGISCSQNPTIGSETSLANCSYQ